MVRFLTTLRAVTVTSAKHDMKNNGPSTLPSQTLNGEGYWRRWFDQHDSKFLNQSSTRRLVSGTLGGVDESQKCISTGPYERFYGLKMQKDFSEKSLF